MTTSATLALVIVLHAACGAQVEETAAVLPESTCLAAMRQVWSLPADQVADGATVDAYCVQPDKAPAIGEQRTLR